MGTLLEELWYGNITPQEDNTKHSTEVKHLIALMGKNRDALCAKLTDEQKEILAKYDDCVNEMYSVIEYKAFAYGFRLGIRLMLEAFTELDFER